MIEVTIDTREQTPWSFPQEMVIATIGTVHTGDYALTGDEDNFAIERKSLSDFLGTISTGWPRFLRELQRMDDAHWQAKVIIVEDDFLSCCYFTSANGEIVAPDHEHHKLQPQFIAKRIAQLSYKHRCCVLFASNPAHAAALALAILKERNGDLNAC